MMAGPYEIHPRLLEKLTEEISESLAIIFAQLQMTGEVPEDRRRANIVPIFKKVKRKFQKLQTVQPDFNT